MLSELQVKNLAIIEDLSLNFKNGLNIISGETGAGKSILLKSLSLLMGAKANNDMIRVNAKEAVVEGLFDISLRPDIQKKLEELGIPYEDKSLLVKRILSKQSKSKIYLNSSLSTLHDLAAIVSPLVEVTSNSAPLIELTSQHESKSLMAKSYHMHILDRYGMAFNLRKEIEDLYTTYQEVDDRLEQIKKDAETKAVQLDFLIYQRDEIKNLSLKENEEQELESNYNKIRHAKKIQDHVEALEANLWSDNSGALSKLHEAKAFIAKLEEIDTSSFSEKTEILQQAIHLVDELSYQIQSYAQNIDINDMDIQSIEERLNKLRKLQKKYGPSVEDILNHLKTIENDINEIENFDDVVKELEDKKAKIYKELNNKSKQLSKKRHNAKTLLENSVNEELKDLNMKGMQFHVHIDTLEKVQRSGIDEIEFQCKSGKNTQARSLAKTASGGELSRILLALKNVIGTNEIPRTYLFDEVDAGVSGETAEKVGNKLLQISQGQQVICISHLPQVACFADVHFYIEKAPQKTESKMLAKELNTKERVQEIARLISGEKITKTSIAHAKDLLKINLDLNGLA